MNAHKKRMLEQQNIARRKRLLRKELSQIDLVARSTTEAMRARWELDKRRVEVEEQLEQVKKMAA